MIITQQKPFAEILEILKGCSKIFLVGCGECATTCMTGGKEEISAIQKELEKNGKEIVGSCIPNAPCIAAQVKVEFAKHINELKQADAVLVLACGLGAQSVKDNDRLGLVVLAACNSLFGAVVDAKGNFYEKCSLCGECVLAVTGGICPNTLCSKGLLNGPCGGMNKGKCEVDPDRDCAWVLIFRELEKKRKLKQITNIMPARDFRKSARPQKIIPKHRPG